MASGENNQRTNTGRNNSRNYAPHTDARPQKRKMPSSQPRDIYISRMYADNNNIQPAGEIGKKNLYVRKKKVKTKKIIFTVVCVLLAIAIAGGGFAYWYTNDMLNGVNFEDNDEVQNKTDEGEFSKIYDEKEAMNAK